MLSKKLAGKYQQTDKPVKDKNKNVLTVVFLIQQNLNSS